MILIHVECFTWTADKLFSLCRLGSDSVRPEEALRDHDVIGEELSQNRGSVLSQLAHVVSSRAASPVISACFLLHDFKTDDLKASPNEKLSRYYYANLSFSFSLRCKARITTYFAVDKTKVKH